MDGECHTAPHFVWTGRCGEFVRVDTAIADPEDDGRWVWTTVPWLRPVPQQRTADEDGDKSDDERDPHHRLWTARLVSAAPIADRLGEIQRLPARARIPVALSRIDVALCTTHRTPTLPSPLGVMRCATRCSWSVSELYAALDRARRQLHHLWRTPPPPPLPLSMDSDVDAVIAAHYNAIHDRWTEERRLLDFLWDIMVPLSRRRTPWAVALAEIGYPPPAHRGWWVSERRVRRAKQRK